MDTGKAADDDGKTTEVTGFKSSVLTRGTLTVVVVTNNDPLDTLVTVFSRDSGNTCPFLGDLVLDLVSFTVSLVDGTDQAVLYCIE